MLEQVIKGKYFKSELNKFNYSCYLLLVVLLLRHGVFWIKFTMLDQAIKGKHFKFGAKYM